MSRYAQPSAMDHPPRPMAQRVGAILWPSFFAAGVATMVFFALIDPMQLRDMTFPDVSITPGTGLHGRLLHVLAGDGVVQPLYLAASAACEPVQQVVTPEVTINTGSPW